MTTRNERLVVVLVMVVLLCLAPSSAMAYVGPGSGVTVIGAALALIGGVFLAVVGFIWYPVKRLLRRFKQRGQASSEDVSASSAAR